MQKLKKTFSLLVLLLIVTVVLAKYRQFVLQQDFLIHVNVACDPAVASCFTADCGDAPDCDASPYQKLEISAREAPVCLRTHRCLDFACPAESASCLVTFCDAATVEDGESCTASTTPS